jgi:hypothetical protein
MKPTELISAVKDPSAWKLQSSIMRRSAEVLWDKFSTTILESMKTGIADDELFEVALNYMQTCKLLYGLALETALKATIVANAPQDIDLRVRMNGLGELTEVEVKSLGVPSGQGHDLLALAEKAGLFGPCFEFLLVDAASKNALKQICRHLGEIVVWRGRYPAPMRSFDPIELDPTIPQVSLGHYMRDWLDPIFDALDVEGSGHVDSRVIKWRAELGRRV